MKKGICFLILCQICTGICCAAKASPTLKAPVFSRTYTVKGTLHIPYAEIEEPFYAWYDGNSGRSRIDYYGGIFEDNKKLLFLTLFVFFIT